MGLLSLIKIPGGRAREQQKQNITAVPLTRRQGDSERAVFIGSSNRGK